MQLLAGQMAKKVDAFDFIFNIDVAPKYVKSKSRIAFSGCALTGGLEHPHYIDSYQIISSEVISRDFK